LQPEHIPTARLTSRKPDVIYSYFDQLEEALNNFLKIMRMPGLFSTARKADSLQTLQESRQMVRKAFLFKGVEEALERRILLCWHVWHTFLHLYIQRGFCRASHDGP